MIRIENNHCKYYIIVKTYVWISFYLVGEKAGGINHQFTGRLGSKGHLLFHR